MTIREVVIACRDHAVTLSYTYVTYVKLALSAAGLAGWLVTSLGSALGPAGLLPRGGGAQVHPAMRGVMAAGRAVAVALERGDRVAARASIGRHLVSRPTATLRAEQVAAGTSASSPPVSTTSPISSRRGWPGWRWSSPRAGAHEPRGRRCSATIAARRAPTQAGRWPRRRGPSASRWPSRAPTVWATAVSRTSATSRALRLLWRANALVIVIAVILIITNSCMT